MGCVKESTVTSTSNPALACPAVTRPGMQPYSTSLPRSQGPDRAEVIHRIRLVVGLMEPVVKARLEGFQT